MYKRQINKGSFENIFIEDFSAGYGIAVKKGNTKLLNRLNYGLKMIHQDGTYQRIFDRYFPK